jgi:hypothetical protein
MAEVHVLPGVERRDLVGPELTAKAVLLAALDNGVTDIVIVGIARDGSQYIAGCSNDVDRVVGKLFAAATTIASGEFEAGVPEAEPA